MTFFDFFSRFCLVWCYVFAEWLFFLELLCLLKDFFLFILLFGWGAFSQSLVVPLSVIYFYLIFVNFLGNFESEDMFAEERLYIYWFINVYLYCLFIICFCVRIVLLMCRFWCGKCYYLISIVWVFF